jgi:hypothetical protein
LALADQDAEAAQQRHQSGHCHLPLMSSYLDLT